MTIRELIERAQRAQQKHEQKHDVQLAMQDCPICFKPLGTCNCNPTKKN